MSAFVVLADTGKCYVRAYHLKDLNAKRFGSYTIKLITVSPSPCGCLTMVSIRLVA